MRLWVMLLKLSVTVKVFEAFWSQICFGEFQTISVIYIEFVQNDNLRCFIIHFIAFENDNQKFHWRNYHRASNWHNKRINWVEEFNLTLSQVKANLAIWSRNKKFGVRMIIAKISTDFIITIHEVRHSHSLEGNRGRGINRSRAIRCLWMNHMEKEMDLYHLSTVVFRKNHWSALSNRDLFHVRSFLHLWNCHPLSFSDLKKK